MRVLHLYAGNLFGGIERMLVTLARCGELCPGMQPHFALCFEGRLAHELRDTRVPVHHLGAIRFSRPWTVRSARQRLRELLREQSFDAAICHGCWPHAAFAPVLKRCDVPLVFFAHDIPRGTHWLERLAARTRPKLVLANSRFTASAVPKLFRGVPCEVCYPPVEFHEIPNRASVRRQIRRELGTPDDAFVVALAARWERLKGHIVLFKALEQISGARWECWIAGGAQRPTEKSYLQQVVRLAQKLNIASQIKFLGHRDDVPRIFHAADIYCQPNVQPESFGIAFVEALAAGLPVVTTAIGAAPEIIDASSGLCVAADDPAVLAEVLQRLIEKPELRLSLGANGPERAKVLCNPADVLPQLKVILERATTSITQDNRGAVHFESGVS